MTATVITGVRVGSRRVIRHLPGPRTARRMPRVALGDDEGDPTAGGRDPVLAAGTDYAFEVDGSGPFPDPRSAWQPHGVHAFSRTFDAEAFAWTRRRVGGRDARGAVTYELHIGTFTAEGTLDAITATALQDLARRGIEMIELMPVRPSPATGLGLRRRRAVRRSRGLRRPRRTATLRRCCARPGHRRVPRRRLQPLGARRKLPRRNSGPYFTTPTRRRGDGPSISISPVPAECATSSSTTPCAGLPSSTLTRCGSMPCTPSSTTPPFTCSPSSRSVPAHWPPARSAAVPRGGVRPQRARNHHAPRRATAAGAPGLGMTAQWADDVHHALHAYLTGERHGYYVDFGSIETLDKAYRDVFVHDGAYLDLPRQALGRARSAPRWTGVASWSAPQTTTRWATAR